MAQTKLLLRWGGLYTTCSQLAPQVYRVRRMKSRKKKTSKLFVHLTHLYSYRPRETPPIHQFDKLAGFCVGKTIVHPRWVIQTKLSKKLSHMSLTKWSVTSLYRAEQYICTSLTHAHEGIRPRTHKIKNLEDRAHEVCTTMLCIIAAYKEIWQTSKGFTRRVSRKHRIPRHQWRETIKWRALSIATKYELSITK